MLTLAAGQRLGPYEILSPLGEGGMGEVWKARDTPALCSIEPGEVVRIKSAGF